MFLQKCIQLWVFCARSAQICGRWAKMWRFLTSGKLSMTYRCEYNGWFWISSRYSSSFSNIIAPPSQVPSYCWYRRVDIAVSSKRNGDIGKRELIICEGHLITYLCDRWFSNKRCFNRIVRSEVALSSMAVEYRVSCRLFLKSKENFAVFSWKTLSSIIS